MQNALLIESIQFNLHLQDLQNLHILLLLKKLFADLSLLKYYKQQEIKVLEYEGEKNPLRMISRFGLRAHKKHETVHKTSLIAQKQEIKKG